MIPHFKADDTALLLIDYQLGTLQLARTTPADVALRNAVILAKAAQILNIPIIMTSSQEDHIQGAVDPRFQRVAPEAFEQRIKREGLVDAWRDPNFRGAVEATGRKQLVIGAITTDICLVFPAVSAVEDGFEVQAVMDACGSPFEINEDISRRRLDRAGVLMTVTATIVAELVGSWATPQGAQIVKLLPNMMQPID